MEKMSAPTLEVILFNTEDDVIVTSGLRLGIQASPIHNDRRYATIGSELIDAGVERTIGNSPSDINSKDIYLFITREYDGIIAVDKKWSQAPSDMTYAWYHSNQWYTGSLAADAADQNIPPLTEFTSFYSN